jgi:hypothetical protein
MTTGKQKSARIDPDYWKRAGRRKWWLTGAFAALTVLVVAALVVSGRWKSAASPGPLHTVHAAWDNDCAACHLPFSPAGGDNALGRAFRTRPDDKLCMGCHKGPPHHPGREIAAEVGGCGSCHHEHRGRHASLTDLRNEACTTCHAKLADHVASQPPRYDNVTRFEVDHPEFRRPPIGAERVKFNHHVHLTAGLKHSPNDAKAWTLNDITEDVRERYRRQQQADDPDTSKAVQLTCASCHETDGGTTPTAGAYLPPVTYEKHCQGCHPLTLGAALPGVTVPHRLQAEDVHLVLWGAFAKQAVDDPARREPKPPPSPLPGRSLDPKEEKARAEVEDRVGKEEKFLYQEDVGKLDRLMLDGKTACGLCHQYKPPEGGAKLPRVVPVRVREVWFEHAWFDHRSHRAVDCQQCHAGATTSTTNTPPLLPVVADCQKCHAPRGTQGGKTVGGVRSECTTCHAYHDSDGAVRGRADTERRAARRGTIDEFLSGRLGQP